MTTRSTARSGPPIGASPVTAPLAENNDGIGRVGAGKVARAVVSSRLRIRSLAVVFGRCRVADRGRGGSQGSAGLLAFPGAETVGADGLPGVAAGLALAAFPPHRVDDAAQRGRNWERPAVGALRRCHGVSSWWDGSSVACRAARGSPVMAVAPSGGIAVRSDSRGPAGPAGPAGPGSSPNFDAARSLVQ